MKVETAGVSGFPAETSYTAESPYQFPKPGAAGSIPAEGATANRRNARVLGHVLSRFGFPDGRDVRLAFESSRRRQRVRREPARLAAPIRTKEEPHPSLFTWEGVD